MEKEYITQIDENDVLSGFMSNIHNRENQKLQGLVKMYERENQDYKFRVEGLEITKATLLEKVAQYEKQTAQLNKRIKSLEATIHFEKKAAEGIAKKCGILELDVPSLKEERVNLLAEQNILKKKISDFDEALNNDRSKRLQLMHENEVLKSRNEELEKWQHESESALSSKNRETLGSLQRLETSMSVIESQKQMLDEQNATVVSMGFELLQLKDSQLEQNKLLAKYQEDLAVQARLIDAQEKEIFRLRKSVLSLPNASLTHMKELSKTGSTTSSLDMKLLERSNSESGGIPNSLRNNIFRKRVGGSERPLRLDGSKGSSTDKEIKDDFDMSSYLLTNDPPKKPLSPPSSSSLSLLGDKSTKSSKSGSRLLDSPPNKEAEPLNEHPGELFSQKSHYLGQGLGLKKSVLRQYVPQCGSSKFILAKVLSNIPESSFSTTFPSSFSEVTIEKEEESDED